jgi:hypothetical protein
MWLKMEKYAFQEWNGMQLTATGKFWKDQVWKKQQSGQLTTEEKKRLGSGGTKLSYGNQTN